MADYSHLKVAELDKLLEDRDLTVEGHKADKVKALEDADAKASEQPPDQPPDAGDPPAPTDPPVPDDPDPQTPDDAADPADDESAGRVVRHATYVTVQGRRSFYDVGMVMEPEVIEACHVGDHIFEEHS